MAGGQGVSCAEAPDCFNIDKIYSFLHVRPCVFQNIQSSKISLYKVREKCVLMNVYKIW